MTNMSQAEQNYISNYVANVSGWFHYWIQCIRKKSLQFTERENIGDLNYWLLDTKIKYSFLQFFCKVRDITERFSCYWIRIWSNPSIMSQEGQMHHTSSLVNQSVFYTKLLAYLAIFLTSIKWSFLAPRLPKALCTKSTMQHLVNRPRLV